MTEGDAQAVKAEIAFFMEKSFQITFGYLGSAAALTAGVAVDDIRALLTEAGVEIGPLWAVILLVLNVMYLTAAGGCLFAVLKRGYFILIHSAASSTNARWERFLRTQTYPVFGLKVLDRIAWNFDNFYMAPVLFAIGLSSVGASAYAWNAGSDPRVRWAVAGLLLLHALPVAIFLAISRLDYACRTYTGSDATA